VSVRDENASKFRSVRNEHRATNSGVVVSSQTNQLPSSCHLRDQLAHGWMRCFGLFARFEESLKNIAVQHNAIAGRPRALQETLR